MEQLKKIEVWKNGKLEDGEIENFGPYGTIW